MDAFSSYIPIDRRRALAIGGTLPEKSRGAVLFTDISSFTKLTEALVNALGYEQGAEELGNNLNKVYGVLINAIHSHHGSVVVNGGDALISWFEGGEAIASSRAINAAFAMQKSLNKISKVSLPDGSVVELGIKSGVACGEACRLLAGDPAVQSYEVLAGELLDQVGYVEGTARRDEVVITTEAAVLLGNEIVVSEQRKAEGGLSVSVVESLSRVREYQNWDAIPALEQERSKPWLHPFIYEHINSGQEMFMAQLRPSVALFMSFEGIQYDTDPEAGKKLDNFFRWVQRNVGRYGGTIINLTTGDKGNYFYITLGAPYAHEDDTARAVELARNLLHTPTDLYHIHQIKIGISYGMIWSGPIGNKDWKTFSAIGNDVNLAARLMELAAPGKMLVSKRVADATRENYHWQMAREVALKGLAKPIKVFEPVDKKHTNQASKLLSSMNIVGREAERQLLSKMLLGIGSDTHKTAVIEGEAGIGKSYLVRDLVSQANGIPILVGAGNAIEQSTPYHAWRSVFENIFELDLGMDSEQRREKAVKWLRELDENLLDRVPLLASVLSFEMQDNALTGQITGQVRADNTRELLITILKHYIGETSKLLVLEDAHWFDSPSLALTSHVARNLTNVMIVITTRLMQGQMPEHLESILNHSQTHHIALKQMGHTDIATLICNKLNVKNLPSQVSDLILSKAEGHPFFSEELASSLHESGVIVIENGECRVASETDLRTMTFPDTVQGVVRSRIDRLPPSHQLALKAASVIGRTFAVRAVRDVYPLDSDKPQVSNYFEYLHKLDFTPLNSTHPELTYFFKHVITQEVAYNLMTFSQRQSFHHEVATWYERTFADDLSPYYGILSHHWRNAKNPQKTMEYLEKAGEHAMLNFANTEAIEFFNEALQLAKNGEAKATTLQRAHWERQTAEAYYGLGELPKSLEHLKNSIQLMGWNTSENLFRIIRALLSEVFKQVRFRIKAAPLNDTPPPTYLENTDQAKWLEGAIAFVRLGHIYYQMNNPVLLIYGNVKGSNLAEQAGLKSPILVRGYTNMCIASGVLPRHTWAIAYRNRAHAMGRDVGDLPALSYSLSGCAVYELGAGLWDNALKSLLEAIDIDARIGDMRHFDESKSLVSIIRFHLGEFEYGLHTAAEVLERAANRKDVIPQVWSHTLRAEIILRQSKPGTLDQAIDGFEKSLKLLEQNIDLASDIRASGALALAYWRNNNPARALDLAAATSKKTNANPTAPYSIEGYAGVAEVFLSAWEQGDANQRKAAQKACKAMAKFAGVFPLGQPRLKLYQGWFDYLDGKMDKAKTNWDAALAEAESLKMPYEQARALLFLGKYILTAEAKAEALNKALSLFDKLEVQYEPGQIRELI